MSPPQSLPGPEALRPILTIVPRARNAGVLQLKVGDAVYIDVALAPAHVYTMLVMVDATLADRENKPLRGYRSADDLGQAYSARRGSTRSEPVQADAIIHSVWQIRKRIREAVARHNKDNGTSFSVPEVIEQFPGVGYRIGKLGLEICID